MTHKPTRAELLDLTARLQQDLRAATSKLVELRAWIAALPADEPATRHRCPECGLDRPTAAMLTDHLANVHGKEAA